MSINDANFKPLSEGVTLYPGQRVIKIGNRMFPVGIGNNAMPAKGGMNFYKCAAVYGPRKVTRIKVENAGTAAVNGEYELTDLKTSSGGEVWKHTEADYYYYSESDYNWGIDADYNMPVYRALYYHDMAEPTSSNSYWNTGYDYDNDKATGIDPAPTVSEIQITVDADVPKTWDGYKAVLTDGIYEFEKTLTTGLTYGEAFTPVKGRIFDDGCTIKVEAVWTSIPLDDLIFYDPLDGGTPDTPIIGGNYTSGSLSYTVIDGIACADITEGQQLIKNDISGYPANNITLSCWARKKGNSGFQNLFGYGIDSTFRACMLRGNKDSGVFGVERASGQIYSDVNIMDGKWHHLAATIGSSGDNTLFVDGVAVHSFSDQFNIDGNGSLAVGGWVNGGFAGDSYLAACRLYSRVLTDKEISDLANEFSTGGGDNGDNGDSGGDIGGSDDGKTYVYTVSGFGTADVNGDYYDSGETNQKGNPVYTNGKCNMSLDDIWLWSIYPAGSTSDNNYYWLSDVNATTPTGTGWEVSSGVPPIGTVTDYAGGDSGDSGSSDTYIVSGAGMSDANGTYTRSGDTYNGHPLYVKGKFSLYYDADIIREFTVITHPDYPAYIYSMPGGSDGNYASRAWEINDPTFAPAPTVVKGGSESGDSGSGDSGSSDGKTYLYTVSGAGTAAANGDYWDTGETNYGFPICTNGNYYLYFFAGDEWWVLDDVMNAPPFAYHCSVMNVLPNEGSWTTESGASPAPTITKYSGGNSGTDAPENGGDADPDEPIKSQWAYRVSGAGTAAANGLYYNTGETTKGPVGDDLGYYIYSNGTAKIEFMTDYLAWSISLDGSQKYVIIWDDEAMTTGTTATAFGDDPAPTITKVLVYEQDGEDLPVEVTNDQH